MERDAPAPVEAAPPHRARRRDGEVEVRAARGERGGRDAAEQGVQRASVGRGVGGAGLELEQLEQEGKEYMEKMKGMKERLGSRLGQISGFLGLNTKK